ncbi:hypothetical protein [Roseicyclus sp.]|uniref:hypothetical protein n=1 Tax=Roseicyclus sp. TaxID=1914329 RepID=UPI0040539FD3
MPQYLSHKLWAAGVGLALLASPLAAHSPQIVPPEASQSIAPGQQARTARPQPFDWRANRPAPASIQPARLSQAAPGRGSYICTAAGSGRMSRCVAR